MTQPAGEGIAFNLNGTQAYGARDWQLALSESAAIRFENTAENRTFKARTHKVENGVHIEPVSGDIWFYPDAFTICTDSGYELMRIEFTVKKDQELPLKIEMEHMYMVADG